MGKLIKLFMLIPAMLSVGLVLAACGSTIVTSVPTQPTNPAFAAAYTSIDDVLKNAVTGHIAYNAPEKMQLDGTVDIQLLLSPTASVEALTQQIVEAGKVTGAELLVTPIMKAELISEDAGAFSIQPFHDTPDQVVLTDAPTEWRWAATAKKSGDQVLTLTIKRQVTYNGETSWRLVETYKNTIHIQVSPGQVLRNFDWKWLAGILLVGLLIPAIWRLVDNRKNKTAAPGAERGR